MNTTIATTSFFEDVVVPFLQFNKSLADRLDISPPTMALILFTAFVFLGEIIKAAAKKKKERQAEARMAALIAVAACGQYADKPTEPATTETA